MKAETFRADLIESIMQAAQRMGEYQFAFVSASMAERHVLEAMTLGNLVEIRSILQFEGWMV